MLVKLMEPNFVLDNENGNLTQLVREGWSQINVITSNKNIVRGNHYHKINREAFFVISGKFKLILRQGDITEEMIFEKGAMFMISPQQIHTFEYLEDTVLVAMYDKGVELSDGEKDIYS